MQDALKTPTLVEQIKAELDWAYKMNLEVVTVETLPLTKLPLETDLTQAEQDAFTAACFG